MKCNKILALIGVLFALLLSCVIINFGLAKYNPNEPIIEKTVETRGLNDRPSANKACCVSSHKVESTSVIAETNYDNTTIILLYANILAFIVLSL